jgi:surface polysaccharide O-acyltransferase-like enzyme
MDPLFISFQLQAFVFVSGYLFGLMAKRNIEMGWGKFVMKKFRRIYLPSLIGSALYLLFFLKGKGWAGDVYAIASGCGHLWFLPMLFWNYLLMKLVARRVDRRPMLWLLLSLAVSATVPPLFNVLNMGMALKYFPFFVMGYVGYKEFGEKTFEKKYWIVGLTLFVLLFVVRQLMLYYDCHSLRERDVIYYIGFLAEGVTGIAGVMIMAKSLFAHYNPTPFVLRINNECYGAYIIHQFILQWMIFHSAIPQLVGAYALPWVAMGVAVVGAFAGSKLIERRSS